MPIKTIEVQGNPDGMMFDAADERAYILSHSAPHVTAIDAKDGSVLGTIDIGGMPEQAATDGKGHMYIDVEDKGGQHRGRGYEDAYRHGSITIWPV